MRPRRSSHDLSDNVLGGSSFMPRVVSLSLHYDEFPAHFKLEASWLDDPVVEHNVHDKNSHPSSHYLQQRYNGRGRRCHGRPGSSTEMHYWLSEASENRPLLLLSKRSKLAIA